MSHTFDDLPLFRVSDPDTSRQIRRSTINSQCIVLLSFYRQSSIGLTDEQVSAQAAQDGHPINGYWKRCSDLRRLGLIVDCGVRRTLSTGATGMVCAITAKGIEALK